MTRWLPFSNAYDSAREKIPAVIKQAEKDAGARTVRFVATGHSLGGGLAQHVAYMFSCFSAVTFDSSCVINPAGSKFEPKVVNVYETGDELTRFCKFGAGIGESENYRQYNVKVIKDGFHHRMLGFVVGMSRVVADCQQDLISGKGPCAIPITDRRAHDLYCYAYGYVGPDKNVCESKYWKPPTGPS